MNRMIFPFLSPYPLSGDIESTPGTNYVTVVGLQHYPVSPAGPVNGDVLMFQSPSGSPASPAFYEWTPVPWGILKAYVSPIPIGSPAVETLIIDASTANSFHINVNVAIAAMDVINGSEGQELTLGWFQDSTGHSITLASNLKGATAPSTGANTVSYQKFSYDLAEGNWYSLSAGSTGM